MPPGFFDGLVVVELADRRNQYAGKLFADAGAEVLQVEPLAGSPGRHCGPFVHDRPDLNACLDHWYYNAGKRSVCIDIARPPGQALVRRLASKADVLLESTPPGALASAGLDYAGINNATNGKIIYASLTDFGQDGPWRDYLANDVAHLALGGQMASSGYSDPKAPPIGGQGHQAWHVAGALCVQAVTVALIERMDSGRGQHLDCAIHDCCSVCTEIAVPQWVYTGKVLYRHTGQHAQPYRQAPLLMKAGDGRYVNVIFTDLAQHLWVGLVQWMKEYGVEGNLDSPEYLDIAHRTERWRFGTEIQEAMARLVSKLTAEEAMRRGQSVQLPMAAVRAPEENYDEPHWAARDFFMPVEHAGADKPVRYPGAPFKCAVAPLTPRGRAPDLGEHTELVLRERLGLSAGEIQSLRRAGVVR